MAFQQLYSAKIALKALLMQADQCNGHLQITIASLELEAAYSCCNSLSVCKNASWRAADCRPTNACMCTRMLAHLPWTVILQFNVEVLEHGSLQVYFQIVSIMLWNQKRASQRSTCTAPVAMLTSEIPRGWIHSLERPGKEHGWREKRRSEYCYMLTVPVWP